MKKTVIVGLTIVFYSCASIKVDVPAKFAAEATNMHVKGLRGWRPSPKLSFGKYFTSAVKKGLVAQKEKNNIPGSFLGTQEMLHLFNISKTDITATEKNKFHYKLSDGRLSAEIICLEKFTSQNQQLGGPHIGLYSKTLNAEYYLTGFIQNIKNKDTSLWNLQLYSKYNNAENINQFPIVIPGIEQAGYLIHDNDSITIQPVKINKITTRKNKTDIPVRLLSGYEFRIDDGVIGIVDILNDNIWLYNDLDDDTKLIIAAAASAILLRKQNH